MKIVILLALSCSFVSSHQGSPWSEEEAIIVKAKLYSVINQGMFTSKEYLKLHPELGLDKWSEQFTLPGAAKLVRLGFHQCLKYSDGSGGCNGCLNNHGKSLSSLSARLY